MSLHCFFIAARALGSVEASQFLTGHGSKQ